MPPANARSRPPNTSDNAGNVNVNGTLDGNVDQLPDSDPETEPQPEPEPAPWFSELGDAVSTGVLSTPAATAIRRGLGEPAVGVTEADLTQALAGFIPEAATLNADQASKAARALRDRIDQAGIASRSAAMKSRQNLRVWDKPDGMLHGNFELDPENGSVFRDFM